MPTQKEYSINTYTVSVNTEFRVLHAKTPFEAQLSVFDAINKLNNDATHRAYVREASFYYIKEE